MLQALATGEAPQVLEFFDLGRLASIGSIIVIDIVLSGDNAIVIGMAVAGLPEHLRKKAIVIGIAAATILRIAFALVTFQLLLIIGLTLAGGLLLLWVCWRMWREIRESAAERDLERLALANGDEAGAVRKPVRTLRQALILIVVADVSMSLDNVLAVAGAAREDPTILLFGLVLSIALMALAATYIAKLLNRHHWIAYVGLGVVFFVAIDMIWRGSEEVMHASGVM
jgi:YjbE family integral membrane protein